MTRGFLIRGEERQHPPAYKKCGNRRLSDKVRVWDNSPLNR